MQTNSPAQQAVRKMNKAAKADYRAARLAEISRLQDEAIATYRRHTAEIAEARARGASEAEIWGITNGWFAGAPQ